MKPDRFVNPLSFSDALDRVLAGARALCRTETITLRNAAGRVAVDDIRSSIDVPPFDRAAMDGYAVLSVDLAAITPGQPATLRLAGQALAGAPLQRTIEAGFCCEIATGAPIPPGADAVVMVERTSRDGDHVLIHERVGAGHNIGRRGADIATGQAVIRDGDYLTPARVGALAAMGCRTVRVYARPTVAVLSTGAELAAPGMPVTAGQIYDVNSETIAAVVGLHGGAPQVLPPVSDSVVEIAAALETAASHDIVVTSGGSSVGSKDVLTDALEGLGRVDFHGIAVKPGKPTLFGWIGATPLFGMPGNPSSCLSNAYLLLVPFLRRMARLPAWQPRVVEAPLARRIVSNAGRHQFYTVRLVSNAAEPAFKSSGDITSMADADGYIEIAADVGSIEAGERVTVKLF